MFAQAVGLIRLLLLLDLLARGVPFGTHQRSNDSQSTSRYLGFSLDAVPSLVGERACASDEQQIHRTQSRHPVGRRGGERAPGR